MGQGLTEHHFGQGHDETGTFGQGDELVGQESSFTRMLPANEGFGPADATGGQVQLRLEEQVEFVVLDGCLELGDEGQPARTVGVALCRVDGDAASIALGQVHGHVGPLEEGDRILGMIGGNLTPLLASATIIGATLGFGAQLIIRDYMSGFLLTVEDQYGIGDSVTIGTVTGVV